MTVSLGTTVVIGLVGAALWLWLAAANSKGKSWARIVATVFFAVAVLYFAWGIAQPSLGLLASVLSVASILVASILGGAVAAALLWKPESSRYYDSRRRNR